MAASSRLIYIPTTFVGGAHVANAARYAIMAQNEINRAVAVAASVTGFGATPINLEGSSEFGVNAGQGAAFYSAITTLQTNLNAITSAQLAVLDAGG